MYMKSLVKIFTHQIKLAIIFFFVFIPKIDFSQENAVSDQIPSTIAFTIVEKDLFPEGITYDPMTKLFFLAPVFSR